MYAQYSDSFHLHKHISYKFLPISISFIFSLLDVISENFYILGVLGTFKLNFFNSCLNIKDILLMNGMAVMIFFFYECAGLILQIFFMPLLINFIIILCE